jgi:hypothetical protein
MKAARFYGKLAFDADATNVRKSLKTQDNEKRNKKDSHNDTGH